MDFPKEIFPENKVDPTVDPKQHEMSVEQTLGVMGHIKSMTRNRGKNWRFLQNTENLSHDEMAAKILAFYELPEAVPLFNRNGMWAAWAGEGEPDIEPFENDEAINAQGEEVVLAAHSNGDIATIGFAPTNKAETEAIAEAAPPGTVLSTRTLAPLEAHGFTSVNKSAPEALQNETWAFSTKDIGDHVAMRKRYDVRHDAPIEIHPNGDVAAIWLGKGAPTRPAFVPPTDKSETLNRAASEGVSHGITQLTGGLDRSDKADKKVKVSPHAPGAALNDMGLRLYSMSQEKVYNDATKAFLLQVSDTLHAEAARIDLVKVRANYDRKP